MQECQYLNISIFTHLNIRIFEYGTIRRVPG